MRRFSGGIATTLNGQGRVRYRCGPVNFGQISGYSESLDMHWTVKERRFFCGHSDYPVGSQSGPDVIFNQLP
jgi:hypothetical protein